MINQKSDADFRPRGALAFFVLLLLACAALWFGLYMLMLNKS